MENKIYLVEVRLKDWVISKNRILAYEEVEANNEFYAKHKAYDQFINRIKYEPVMRRKWKESGVSISDICVPDCVMLDD